MGSGLPFCSNWLVLAWFSWFCLFYLKAWSFMGTTPNHSVEVFQGKFGVLKILSISHLTTSKNWETIVPTHLPFCKYMFVFSDVPDYGCHGWLRDTCVCLGSYRQQCSPMTLLCLALGLFLPRSMDEAFICKQTVSTLLAKGCLLCLFAEVAWSNFQPRPKRTIDRVLLHKMAVGKRQFELSSWFSPNSVATLTGSYGNSQGPVFHRGSIGSVRNFPCKFMCKMPLVTCPCAFRLRRLHKMLAPGLTFGIFPVNVCISTVQARTKHWPRDKRPALFL